MRLTNATITNDTNVDSLNPECQPCENPVIYGEPTSADIESALVPNCEECMSENNRDDQNLAIPETIGLDSNSTVITVTNEISPVNTTIYPIGFEQVTPLIHEDLAINPVVNMHNSSATVEATYSLAPNAPRKDRFIIRYLGLISGCVFAVIQLIISVYFYVCEILDETSYILIVFSTILPICAIFSMFCRYNKKATDCSTILYIVNALAWLVLMVAARVRIDKAALAF